MTEDTDKEDEKFTAMEDIMGCACNRGDWTLRSSFKEWLESHDANVRAETLEDVMHDRVADLTPAELIQCAWDAAYPVPDGRMIPRNTGYLSWRNGECVGVYSKGVSYETPGREGDLERRTLAPLPPLIPDGTPAVWASTSDGIDTRRVLVLTEYTVRTWRDGEGDTYHDDDLIDPVPIPKEER